MLKKLLSYWVDSVERCGVILGDETIIELKNISENPKLDFVMREEDFKEYAGRIVATWHTHPITSANLSVEDYIMFRSKPDWYHYIVSEKEVWCYYIRNGKVILHEEENSLP